MRRESTAPVSNEGLVWPSPSAMMAVPVVRPPPHALRHLFASEAINEGVDVYTLADLLGHEDPAFALRRYVHRVTGAVEKARKAIGRRYRAAA
ncbi:tyrosine-type recombinase/integrase [Streptomyces sp. NBC_01716]|uniref:tyrosine-type recombinase/integrase n=1 Tax=Streptomyces sp. NBC_01716 TaxID=2975917 RepID=UPI002E32F1BB|nr:tyrosine-type recombinase/integrase [Streptomyces sp. NBC_01716]